MRAMREHGAVGYVLCPAIGTDAALTESSPGGCRS